MSTKPIWPKFIKGSNGERTNKYKGASLIVSSIGISLSLLLTIAYSNCGKMKTLDFNSLSQNGNLGADLFGSQNGNVNKDHIEGNMSFGKAEIREDESTNLSWSFNWGSSGSSGSNSGYRLQSFGCNQEVFGGYIKNMQSFLNVSGGCDNRTGACSYHADGDKPVSGLPPSATPYSCEIKFQWFDDGLDQGQDRSSNDVKISVSIKVNPKPQDPPPPPSLPREKCEGAELLQGFFERCNDTECVGWAFEYGQVATNIQIRAIQRGEKSRNVTIMTTTTVARSDVNSHLAQQGCLNTGNLLSQFAVSKSTIDAALRAATASAGSGSGSNIQLEAVVVGLTGGRSIGFVENYQPLSPIDPGGNGGGTNNPPVSSLSFVSGPYNVGISGSAQNFPSNTNWCLTPGTNSCDPGLPNMRDWTSTGSAGSGRFNWKYEVRPYQVGWCPGTFTATMQAPGESPKTASFTIDYPNFYAGTGGLQVYNVPPPSVGTLKGCFEYNQNYGPANPPGSCSGKGQTALINNGWSYNESTHSASFGGDSSVFGGRNGTIFFTFDYNCGLSQTTSQSF
ncbi:MAG: hypothetical protein IPL83_17880 [Bdellovibrionales bacterium]|nr:hypothetical protein [Bdellovibrionales bacterium]